MDRNIETDAKRPEQARAGLQRRTLVGAAAWAAPAIVLTQASPAAATSTELGVITFVTSSQRIDGGTSFMLVGTVVPAAGRSLPSELSLAYGGAVTGPLKVAVAEGSFTFVITASNPAAETPSTVTASAPGYAPAEYTCTVAPAVTPEVPGDAFFYPQYVMTLVAGTSVAWDGVPRNGVRSVNPAGEVTDTFTGSMYTNVVGRVLSLTFGLMEVRGRDLPYNIRVVASGGDRLQWLDSRATVTSWSASSKTASNGSNHSSSAGLVPQIIRGTTTTGGRPGGTLTVEYTYPTIPNYRVVVNVPY